MATILVIDDEPEVRDLIQQMLEHAGHTVYETGTGQEGRQLYQEKRADLVICDVFMQERDGISIMLELRRIDPHARVVAMTGGCMAVPLATLQDPEFGGVVGTLSKPFTREMVLKTVATALQADRASPPSADR